MKNQMLKYIIENKLPKNDSKILLAISGGIDSVCLAHLLIELEYEVEFAHCNFKLRGKESDDDVRFVKNLALSYNVPFHHFSFDTKEYSNQHKISIQMARTNEKAINQIKILFPHKNIFSFELNKSDLSARDNALHLDCCFQPIGKNKAIIYEGGFKNYDDVLLITEKFGDNNLIRISREEMYNMNSNIFSISENVIVSENGFKRLNRLLSEQGFIVEEIKFSEIAKMEGLLRCTTLPLQRR